MLTSTLKLLRPKLLPNSSAEALAGARFGRSCLSPKRGLWWRRWRGLLLMIRRRTSRGVGIASSMGMVAVAVSVGVTVIMFVVMSVVGAVIGQRQSGNGQNLKWKIMESPLHFPKLRFLRYRGDKRITPLNRVMSVHGGRGHCLVIFSSTYSIAG